MAGGQLTCVITIQEIAPTGGILRSSQHKNVTLTLGRDEFSEVVLQASMSQKVMKFRIKELIIHKKFVKDGKATIKFPDQQLLLMLCNCPPDKLSHFLTTLQGKFESLREKGFISERKRLLSESARSFEEISPLTMKDLQKLQAAQQAANKPLSTISNTITSSSRQAADNKRKRGGGEMAAPVQKKPKAKEISSAVTETRVLQPIKLSKEQSRVLEAVLSGRNIFFTGSAGTGKSFLLRRIIGALPPNHTFATASTGVAACHIGGTTLHMFAGIGSGKAPLHQCIELASRTAVARQWKACRHLIIDEISMVDGEFFEKLERVARHIRKSDSPFGGIQVIVCGDFLQLPPVCKDSQQRRFCFSTEAWRRCIQDNLELTEVRRQADRKFVDILQNIRFGRCPEFVEDALRRTMHNNIQRDGILATRLCTHKQHVEDINIQHIQALQGAIKVFDAQDSDTAYADLVDKLCPVERRLTLKEGAQVMLARNLDVARGLVNGARGVIMGFADGGMGHPIVRFVCGVEEVIKPVRYVVKVGAGHHVSRKQVPLQLAWAISIHKSQGMTLDCVEMSLAQVFEVGQAYVALSRAKSLEGLRVIDFDSKCVRADTQVLRFYHRLSLTQRMLQTSMDDYS